MRAHLHPIQHKDGSIFRQHGFDFFWSFRPDVDALGHDGAPYYVYNSTRSFLFSVRICPHFLCGDYNRKKRTRIMDPANSENMQCAFVTPEEEPCAVTAANVSCEAMSELAIQEARRNSALLGYQTVYPACARFLELADRKEEHTLQKPATFAKNYCFTKEPAFQEGPWQTQFQSIPLPNVRFDTWTRAKGGNPLKD